MISISIYKLLILKIFEPKKTITKIAKKCLVLYVPKVEGFYFIILIRLNDPSETVLT